MSTRLAVALLLLPSVALAQPALTSTHAPRVGPGDVRQVGAERPVLGAGRLGAAVRVDGRLDEAAWDDAPAAAGFRQRMPAEGSPASRATRVRVLVDGGALYVGARLDEHPDSLSAPLGRRDAHPPSDEFLVYLDTQRDGRTAFVFAVTPSGVRSDARVVGTADADPAWDGVWDAAVARDSAGWTAELRIPLAQLPFAAPPRTRGPAALAWGVEFERVRSRRGETSQWALVPQTAAVPVAHFGELRVPRAGALRGRLQATPYLLARARRLAPGDVSPLAARAGAASALGADVRLAVTSSLALTAAVNPDFGQVEADSAAVNLTALELFLPERRPFFVAGSDLFRVAMHQWYDETSELFYSRRIGRRPTVEAPDDAAASRAPATSTILGAAKLTGRTASGWSLGVLDAQTGAARADWIDRAGARRSWLAEPATNTAVARLTRDLRGGRTVVGLLGTFVGRDLDSAAAATLRRTALSGGVDVLHRTRDYEAQAVVAATDVRGSREAILATQEGGAHFFQRPGADHLGIDSARTGLTGWALSARVAKTGGNVHWEVARRAYSPGYEPNDAGFLAQSDRTLTFAHLDYVRPVREGGRLRRWWVGANVWDYHDFGGMRTALGVNTIALAQLPNFWQGTAYVGSIVAGSATEALHGGPAVRRAPRRLVGLTLDSDPRRALSYGVAADHAHDDGGSDFRSAQIGARVTARPSGRLELTLGPSVAALRDPAQYVATAEPASGTRWVTGALTQRTAALTARAVLAFTPSLTLQGYAQPFVSVGRYGALSEVANAGARRFADRFAPIAPADVAPRGDELVVRGGDPTNRYVIDRPDFATRSMNGSAVLRWDYGPGSALFVVWSHARDGDVPAGAAAAERLSSAARSLWRTAGTNELIVKFSRALTW